MGKIFINEETLIGIGNAIREKSGTTDLINTTDMANAILNLPSGGGTLKYARVITYGNAYGSALNPVVFDLSPYITYEKPFIFLFNMPSGNGNDDLFVIKDPIVATWDGNGNFTYFPFDNSTNSYSPQYKFKGTTLSEDLQLSLEKEKGSYFYPGNPNSSKSFYLHLFYVE